MSAESFTLLAILEARDRASEIFAKVDESLSRFGETAKGAADTARAAGDVIDESLLKTASGADALDVADARVAASQERAARAAQALADAERGLLSAQQEAAAGADADAAAQDRLLTANTRLAAASKENAVAQKALADAQKTQADTAAAAAAKNDLAAAGQKKVSDSAGTSAASLGAMGKIAGVTALGLGVAGALMVKAAGNFQDSTTHLVTDAGESAKNLAMVQAGILQVSTATGQSAAAITNAMYHVESAGYHGAAGLTLLKVAAEGARVGGADLDTVSKTLVGVMNAYGLSASHSASMMNQLIATVGQGDMRMQDLASSLSNVAPLAAAVGIKFSQVGGAIATMTAQGMSADQATQDLAHTIRSLSSPNNVAIAEMNQLGINAQDVSQHLGQRGLTGTISMLTRAITSHMGKSGQVIMSAFTQSTTAGQDLQVMLKNMPPAFAQLAKGYMDGTVTAKQWRAELYAQTPVNRHLMTQFATLYNKSHAFSTLLAAGGPAAQTYTAALAKMMGGATGLNTALMLTGKNQAVFADNAAKVAAAARKGGANVDNWSTIQGTFNYKLASAKTAVENTGIAIGSALLPAATSLLQVVTSIVEPVAEWTAHHRTLTLILFAGVTALVATVAAVALAAKAYRTVTGTIGTVRKGLQVLGVVSRETAVAEEESAGAGAAGWLRSAAAATVATGRMLIMRGAQLAVAAATRIWAAAQMIFNAVMDANPILLVVAAIAALAAGIAYAWTHFATFRRIVEDVFGWLKTAVVAVIRFVKSHWELIVAVMIGPLAVVALLVAKHWNTIKRWFSEGARAVIEVLTWYFVKLPMMFFGWLTRAASAVESAGSRVLGWFRSLPGRIVSLIAGIPAMLFSSGAHIVESLASGIVSSAGSVLHSAMSSVANTIKSFLPFSPAKTGPLSGAGDPGNSGLSITRLVARGIRTGTPQVAGAASAMAASILGATSGLNAGVHGVGLSASSPALSALGGSGAGGGVVINNHIDLRDARVMSDRDMDQLVSKVGNAVATRIAPQAGLRFRF